MLHFIAIGLLIPLMVVLYIRNTVPAKHYYTEKYKNPYLEKYMQAEEDTSQADLYKILSQTAVHLARYEEELQTEMKNLSSLYFSRMISNTLWNDIKAAKEDLEFERLTLEAELGRFSKISAGIETPKEPRVSLESDVYPEDPSELKRSLYQRIMQRKAAE